MRSIYLGLSFLAISLTSFAVNITDDFESGNIGTITQYNDSDFDLALRNDNDDPSLPDTWRSWWFVKANNLLAGQTLNIDISNRGWQYFAPPFYSYDGLTWFRVEEKDAFQSQACDVGIQDCILSFQHTSKYDHVSLAPFLPYTTQKLEPFLERLKKEETVTIAVLGYSQHYHLPIYHLSITDPNSKKQKSRVWIHGRSHPAETPSSFVLEGLINFLISEHPVARNLRTHLIFDIVPMHNVDGIYEGNYRSNPQSVNFENTWYFDKRKPAILTDEAPFETQLLNKLMRELMNAKIPVQMALNLHASNSEPETAVFAFPHFGDDRKTYTFAQRSLWNKQLSFIDYLTRSYENRVELPPEEGFATFLDSYYPETWWWENKQDNVMALTIEMTYGKAGYDHWISDVEQRRFGEALAKSIGAYFKLDNMPELPTALVGRVRRDSIIYQPGFEEFAK